MPLEVTSSIINCLNEPAADAKPKKSFGLSVFEEKLSVRKFDEEVTAETLRTKLNLKDSHVYDVNAKLLSTLHNLEDIQVYRIKNKELIPQAPSVAPSSRQRSATGSRKSASRSGRKQVGREIFKEIRENSELKNFDPLKYAQLENDTDLNAIAAMNKELERSSKECRNMLVQSRVHNNRIGNVLTLDRRRKECITKSANRKEDFHNYPKKFAGFIQSQTDHDAIDWALQSCKYYKNGLEEELFGFHGVEKQQVFSSSSSEAESEDEEANKKKKNKKFANHPPSSSGLRNRNSSRTPKSVKIANNNIGSREPSPTSNDRTKNNESKEDPNTIDIW
jgi:hypothetical protein